MNEHILSLIGLGVVILVGVVVALCAVSAMAGLMAGAFNAFSTLNKKPKGGK